MWDLRDGWGVYLWGFGGEVKVVRGLEWGLILCVVIWGLFSGVWGRENYLVLGFVLRVYLAIGFGEGGLLCGVCV